MATSGVHVAKLQTTRYGCLSKLADMLPGELSEPYRAQLRLLRSAWAEYTQQQQTTTLRRHRADEDAFAQQQQTTTPTLHRADEDAFDDVHRQELQNFIFDFHSRDCFERAFRGSVSVNEGAESTRQTALVHLLGLRENDIPASVHRHVAHAQARPRSARKGCTAGTGAGTGTGASRGKTSPSGRGPHARTRKGGRSPPKSSSGGGSPAENFV